LVEFVAFDVAGNEVAASGFIWSMGPRVKGGYTFWVHEVALSGPPAWGSPLAVAVVRPSTRHRVGVVRNGRWYRTGGRYVDKDHLYSEAHPGSPSGALTARAAQLSEPPRVIAVKPLDDLTMALLSGEAEPV
jgi:hypothetical protein